MKSEMDISEVKTGRGAAYLFNLTSILIIMSILDNHVNPDKTESVQETQFQDEDDKLTIFRWLNHFRTTTFHMFICNWDGLKYVKNERYCEDVYLRKYHQVNGNAYELLLKDCKFFITTKLIQHGKIFSFPSEKVMKHVDLKIVTPLLQIIMKDGNSLHQHIMEALINTVFIGVSNNSVGVVKRRMLADNSAKRINKITNRYSWNSEKIKIRNLCESNDVQSLFDIMYKNGGYYKFTQDFTLDYTKFIAQFNYNVQRLKTDIIEHVDNISQTKMLVKNLAALLYKTENLRDMQELKDIKGNEQDVDDFLRISLNYPMGDVLFNMKTKGTNSQRYRLNCFKIDQVYLWINSMVYKTSKFDLESVILKYKTGTHYIISFKYVFNTMLSKLHSEVVKLVIRYILSKREYSLLENDIKINNKLLYKCLIFS
ncbi:immediate early transcription factor [Choristoneura fumiferana granulovirus]|uniref:Immediate early transcription factor n=1 Tax=Choristoneura fumiferana granulovirus TaxID=56947 RepID=Q8UZM4_GVCF|nr:immediate early transcription factor [Choristoneura fumiferana granulovirus]